VDPTGVIRTAFPPVEDLTIERVSFPEAGSMVAHVVNGGPEPVTIAQVMVDEAYWQHSIEPDRVVPRLGRVQVTIPYPWVDGEPHEVVLVTSTGLTFAHEVEVATLSPQKSARFFGVFALLGLYAGVIPVLIGLLWYPYLRQISANWINFFLAFTVGLLIFLAADSLHEAFETAEFVPDAFQGVGLIVLGVFGAMLAILGLGQHRRTVRGSGSGSASPLEVAYLVALGIGLHNLGEGLAIVAPVASARPRLRHLLFMGLLAGIPTIIGTWIGGFSYSPIAATFFLALGAGAMLVVVYELWKMMGRQEGGMMAPLNATALGLGLLVMYATALLGTAAPASSRFPSVRLHLQG
jgi:zinc transporter ZupT